MSGYTRQSTADIVPTSVVRAAPINAEYNKLRDAFTQSDTGTTGHKHDGSSDEGSYVPFIADLDKQNYLTVDQTNNRFGLFLEVSGSPVEQLRFQDGVIVPVTDNDIDLGTSSLEFKDLYLDGTATIDTLQVDESATITANLTVNGNTTLGDAATDTVTFTADIASPIIPSADDTYDLGAVGSEWRNLYIDGTANIDSLVADTADINGGTIDNTVIGGTTAAAADFTTMDASGNATVGGTFAVTGATTLSSTLDVTGATGIDGNFDINTNKFTVASASGNTAIAGTLGVTGAATLSSTLDVTGAVTANAGVSIDNITIDGTEIDLSSGDLTVDVAGDIILDADGGDVTLKDAGTTYANLKNSSGELVLQSGSTPTTAVTFSGANADFAGTLDVTGAATLDSNLSVAGNATITGNLTVNGTTTTINTTNVVAQDLLIELGNGLVSDNTYDAGIVIERGPTLDNAFIGFDESVDKFTVGTGTFTGASTGDLTITTGTMVANIEGNVTGNLTGNVTGNVTGDVTGTLTGNVTGDVTSSGTIQYANLSDGTITITGFVDEDDMTSDSATLIPTQQSVKAYVATIAGQSNNVVGLTSTAAELNKLDASAVTPATVTLAASDGFVINDISATETKVALISDIDTYVSSSTATLTNKTITSPIVTGLHLNDSGFTVEGSSADDNETTVSFANPTADRTVTIPDATGTVLLDSNIGTSVQAYDANLTSFVTALTLPTADGTAGQFLKTDGAGTVSFASIPTINTLNDIGNVTITSAASGEFLQWNGSAWVNATVEAFDTQTHTTTSTTQVSIAEYAHATYDGVKAVITADDGTNRSITEILITHNGTTAVATEYAQVNTNTALATFDVDISGTDIRILATPAAATSTGFTVKAITL